MISFVLRIVVIELCFAGGFPFEEASEHCFLSIKVLFQCCGFIYCVVPLLFFSISIIIAENINIAKNNNRTTQYIKPQHQKNTFIDRK